LQAQLSASQSAQATLSAQLKQLSSDKADLTAANESLQQALMDRTLQAAQEADAMRQQHSKQLAALQHEQQQQVEGMTAAAAAAQEAYKQVRLGAVCDEACRVRGRWVGGAPSIPQPLCWYDSS
jgi:DNA repair exonuclease SbcCD ATPase subunit